MALHLIKLCVGCDSVADLEDYLTGVRAIMAVSPEALQIRRFLMKPPLHGSGRALTPTWRTASRLAYSILPAWARELYGHDGWPERLSTASLRTVRRTALMIPWRTRLAFPAPLVNEAVARLGPHAIPSRRPPPDQDCTSSSPGPGPNTPGRPATQQ